MRFLMVFFSLSLFIVSSSFGKNSSYKPSEYKQKLKLSSTSPRGPASLKEITKEDIPHETVAKPESADPLFGTYSDEDKSLKGGVVDHHHLQIEVEKSYDWVVQYHSKDQKAREMTHPDALLHHQKALLRPFRGILHRLNPLVTQLFESRSYGLNEVAQLLKVAGLPLSQYLPQPHWTVGMDYYGRPYYTGKKWDIADGAALSKWASQELLPLLGFYSKYLKESSWKIPFKWSLSVPLLSMENYFPAKGFVHLHESHRYLLLSQIQAQMSRIRRQSAFNRKGYFKLLSQLKNRGSFDPYGGIRLSESVVREIKSHKTLFTLKEKRDPSLLTKALDNFVASIQNYHLALKHREGHGEEFIPFESDVGSRQLASTGQLLGKGHVDYAPLVGIDIHGKDIDKKLPRVKGYGASFQIDVKTLFLNPPQDLKVFLPDQFTQGPKMRLEKLGEESIPYWNYKRGYPIGWNDEAYKTYFPSVQTDGDVKHIYRILSLNHLKAVPEFPFPTLLF